MKLLCVTPLLVLTMVKLWKTSVYFHLNIIYCENAFYEGSPRGFGEQGNIGKISKGTREHEPNFREQGNKTTN